MMFTFLWQPISGAWSKQPGTSAQFWLINQIPKFTRNLVILMPSSRMKILSIVCFLAGPLFAMAQRTITGRILDADTQKPVIGSIVSLSDDVYTKTNALGFFQLNVGQKDTSLFIVHHQYGQSRSPIPDIDTFVINLKKKPEQPTLPSDLPLIVLSDTTKAYFDQIQKGDEFNMGPGRDFCDLKVHFSRWFQIAVNSDSIKEYIFNFSFNPTLEKVENMQASIKLPSGEFVPVPSKEIKAIKQHKELTTKSINFSNLKKGAIINLSYDLIADINKIPAVVLNDTIPKLKCYFNINIPDYVKFKSNYDSVAPPVRTRYPGAFLRKYHPSTYYNRYRNNKPYYTTREAVSSSLLIWDYEDLRATAPGRPVELIFHVTDITLIAGNTYGLIPNRILRKKDAQP